MMDNPLEGLGTRLRQLRKDRDLTMEMVVFDINRKYNAGLTKGNLSRWENGKNFPSLDYAVILCLYFNVSLDYLIGTTSVKTPVDLLISHKRTDAPEDNTQDDTEG